MNTMFVHLDLRAEARVLASLLSDAAGVAFHADADGFCSGFLSSRLMPDSLPPMFQVFTEDLDLLSLCEWVERRGIHSLITFDVNILSAAGALDRLAACTAGRLRIYDDHIGAASEVPAKAELVELLPSTPDGLPRIRPSSLFCFEMLRSTGNFPSSSFIEFVAVVAAHGEGVMHSLGRYLPKLGQDIDRLARRVGRGINAYYTDMEIGSEDLTLMNQLVELAERMMRTEPGGSFAAAIQASRFCETIFTADRTVSELIDKESSAATRSQPWLKVKGVPVYLVDVDSPRRILHLVASSTRTKLDEGIVITKQETRSGLSIELRRARSLSSPDLADVLLKLDPSWFLSRGGHPMAAGATLVPCSAQAALDALRNRLELALSEI
jgi:hypothetical protein